MYKAKDWELSAINKEKVNFNNQVCYQISKLNSKNKLVKVGPSESMSKSKKNVVDPQQIIENYGGQWWLNTNNKEISPAFYDLEQKMFSANGFQGQRLFVIPELELIVVRLGLSGGRKEWDNERSFLKSLIDIYE